MSDPTALDIALEYLTAERAHADEAVRLLSVVIDINPEMQEKVRKFVAEHNRMREAER